MVDHDSAMLEGPPSLRLPSVLRGRAVRKSPLERHWRIRCWVHSSIEPKRGSLDDRFAPSPSTVTLASSRPDLDHPVAQLGSRRPGLGIGHESQTRLAAPTPVSRSACDTSLWPWGVESCSRAGVLSCSTEPCAESRNRFDCLSSQLVLGAVGNSTCGASQEIGGLPDHVRRCDHG